MHDPYTDNSYTNPYAANYGYTTGPYAGFAQESAFVDRPRPSAGFVASLLCFPFGILGFIFGFTYLMTGGSARVIHLVFVIYAIVFALLVILFGGLVLVGCRIKYVLDGQALRLYAGWKLAFTVPLYQIVYGEKTMWNRRLIGWGPGNAGLCNRWRNGVRLHVRGVGWPFLYLTPSDSDAFLARLSAFRGQADR